MQTASCSCRFSHPAGLEAAGEAPCLRRLPFAGELTARPQCPGMVLTITTRHHARVALVNFCSVAAVFATRPAQGWSLLPWIEAGWFEVKPSGDLLVLSELGRVMCFEGKAALAGCSVDPLSHVNVARKRMLATEQQAPTRFNCAPVCVRVQDAGCRPCPDGQLLLTVPPADSWCCLPSYGMLVVQEWRHEQ